MKELNTGRVRSFIALVMLSLAFVPLMKAQVLQLNVPDNVKRIVINDYYADYQFHKGYALVHLLGKQNASLIDKNYLSSYNYYKLDSRYNQIMHCKTEGNNTRYDGFIDYNGNFLFIFVKDEF